MREETSSRRDCRATYRAAYRAADVVPRAQRLGVHPRGVAVGPDDGRVAMRRMSGPHRTEPSIRSAASPRSFGRRRLATLAAAGGTLAVALLLCSQTVAGAETIVVLAIADSVDAVLTNIRNWLMGILAGAATVFLTLGGVRRIFGAGDPGEQEKAKEAFKAAGIGYVLAALAPLIVGVLKGIVGA